jgi:DNA-binding transcriptional ArsR family regulator
MRTLYHPSRADLTLTAVLYALSDPARLTITRSLAERGEQPCGSIVTSLAKATLSHHFKVLRESGVIRTRIEGTQHLSSLRRADLDARFPGLLDAVIAATAGAPPEPEETFTQREAVPAG